MPTSWAFVLAAALVSQRLLEPGTIRPPKLFRLPLDPPRLLEEFDKPGHLRSQDERHEGLDEVIHGPQRICLLLDREAVAFGGRLEDDRRVP